MTNLTQDWAGLKKMGRKKFACLIDPDGLKLPNMGELEKVAEHVDLFFVGGSLLLDNKVLEIVTEIKARFNQPVVLFPGSTMQICDNADAIMLLSLISGRNPDLLIGKHVEVAPTLKASGLEVIPVGYMLVDGGVRTSVEYISNTNPLPRDKPEIAVATAMAGELLGLRAIYLDAGSGAKYPVSARMIESVSQNVGTPLIVGGGIRNAEMAHLAAFSGADIVVVGNALEKDLGLIAEISNAVHSIEKPFNINHA